MAARQIEVSIFGNVSCLWYKSAVRYFETRFLEEANEFLSSLGEKSAAKVIYNIDLAEQTNDPGLFKKLQSEIWAFRTRY